MVYLLQMRVFKRGNFSELSYSHNKREGNRVAHCLAKLVANFSDSVVWMEYVPPLVFYFVQTNLASFLE